MPGKSSRKSLLTTEHSSRNVLKTIRIVYFEFDPLRSAEGDLVSSDSPIRCRAALVLAACLRGTCLGTPWATRWVMHPSSFGDFAPAGARNPVQRQAGIRVASDQNGGGFSDPVFDLARRTVRLQPVVPALQNLRMRIHVPSNFNGDGSFSLSARAARPLINCDILKLSIRKFIRSTRTGLL
jgi:hypothetical protein